VAGSVSVRGSASRPAREVGHEQPSDSFSRLCGCFIAALVIGGQAAAQEQTEETKVGQSGSGPLYLSLRAPFAVGVDTNVLQHSGRHLR